MTRLSTLTAICAFALGGLAALPALAQDKVNLVVANSQWLDALRGEGL